MLSFVVAAVLSTAPEANANIFKRRHHAAPADCNTCAPCADSPCAGAPAPTGDAPKGDPAKIMPKGDAPKGDKAVIPGKTDAPKSEAPPPKADAPKADKAVIPEKKAEAPIDIPKDLKDAIDKSDQKAQIMEYLNNTSVPRENRVQYLETVRQTLLPNTKK